MTSTLTPTVVENRYDILFLFDVEQGNPNGDPDQGNTPRLETETGHALMTDVCIKRKIRNVIAELLRPNTPGFDLYVRSDRALQESREIALANVDPSDPRLNTNEGRAQIMCEACVDVRMFGAALGITKSKSPCNSVCGPVQVGMARSFDPVSPQNHAITRMAREDTKEKESKMNQQMGSKSILPYALFGVKIFINPTRAKATGLTEEDVEILKEALKTMFHHDMSATRGFISPRLCVAFKHESIYGNANASDLFSRVLVQKKVEGYPASYGDYDITMNTDNLPEGVTLERWI